MQIQWARDFYEGVVDETEGGNNHHLIEISKRANNLIVLVQF